MHMAGMLMFMCIEMEVRLHVEWLLKLSSISEY
jgi:hypothetical protein